LPAKFSAALAVMAQYHGSPFNYIDVDTPPDPVSSP
jgi:hypothetical protein